jgi:AbiV family abortive infection protein
MPVTAQHLLEGAAYSLEQCGCLLRSAQVLHQSGDHATGKALALLAFEKLGQWTILLDLRRDILAGRCQFTVKEVNDICGDHARKQKAGMKSITIRMEGDQGFKKLLDARNTAKPGTPEQREANERIDKVDRQKQRRVPDERHKQRMEALYVDALSESEWNRPITRVSARDAAEAIDDAINEYRPVEQQQYTHLEFVRLFDEELHDALRAWPDRPSMPNL